MLARPAVFMDGLQRQANQGDVLSITNEYIETLTTAGDGTILAKHIAAGILRRTGPGAGYADTFPSATDILAAIGSYSRGMSFRWTFINGVAFAMTATAGEGISLGTNVNVAASVVRDYLFTITNDKPKQVIAGVATANANATITLTSAQCDSIAVGQMISGTGITAGTTVSSINRSTGVVTMSGNATATGTATLTFSPVITIAGIGARTA